MTYTPPSDCSSSGCETLARQMHTLVDIGELDADVFLFALMAVSIVREGDAASALHEPDDRSGSLARSMSPNGRLVVESKTDFQMPRLADDLPVLRQRPRMVEGVGILDAP